MGGYAQVPDKPVTQKLKFDKSGYVRYIKFDGKNKTGKWTSPSSPNIFFKEVLGVGKQDEFILESKRERKDQSYYEHYRQFYKGIEVENGLFILHFKNGTLTKANGHYVNTEGVDPLPALTPEEAAKSYAAYLQIRNTVPLKFSNYIVIAEIEKVSGSDTTLTTKLCYKIDLMDNHVSGGETGYIDANTGEVLKTKQNWDSFSSTGTFATLYSNTKYGVTQYYNGEYNLIDSSRNAVISTWDLNDVSYSYYLTNRLEFTDNNNNWTQQEHTANHDQMALDIHWALQEIYDYFDEEHQFQSFDGNNHPINAYVHVRFYNGDRDNAYHLTVNNDEFFAFGDGQYTFKPMASLDIVSHEYAHGITHNETGLDNGYIVQRAIKEAFSDIWAIIIENKIAPEKDCWKIGEEVIDVSGKNCIRNIQDPKSSLALNPIADTYGDNIYNDGGNNEAYEKGGVFSHWFYLLAVGGSGTNYNNDHYTVYGLGIDEAAKIVFEGQTGHFGSVTTYLEARTAMIDASDYLYGENSIQSLQVANAWYAVGVGSDPGQLSISGTNPVCTNGYTFTVNNLPSVDTIEWNTGPYLSVYSGQNTNHPVINATGNGRSWVSVRLATDYGSLTLPQKDVWAGPPIVDYIKDQYDNQIGVMFCPDANYGFWPENDILCEPSSYYWSITPTSGIGYGFCSTCQNNWITFTETGVHYLSVTESNTCGTGNTFTSYIVVAPCGYYSYSVSPNPASTEVKLTRTFVQDTAAAIKTPLSASDISANPESNVSTVKIYNNLGTLFYSTKKSGDEFTIPVSNLKDGSYIVEVNDGKQSYSEPLIIKH